MSRMTKVKKALFIHFRTGERDGISFEIEKRAEILKEYKITPYFLSGHSSLPQSRTRIIIPDLKIKGWRAVNLYRLLFGKNNISEKRAFEIFSKYELDLYRS